MHAPSSGACGIESILKLPNRLDMSYYHHKKKNKKKMEVKKRLYVSGDIPSAQMGTTETGPTDRSSPTRMFQRLA